MVHNNLSTKHCFPANKVLFGGKNHRIIIHSACNSILYFNCQNHAVFRISFHIQQCILLWKPSSLILGSLSFPSLQQWPWFWLITSSSTARPPNRPGSCQVRPRQLLLCCPNWPQEQVLYWFRSYLWNKDEVWTLSTSFFHGLLPQTEKETAGTREGQMYPGCVYGWA